MDTNAVMHYDEAETWEQGYARWLESDAAIFCVGNTIEALRLDRRVLALAPILDSALRRRVQNTTPKLSYRASETIWSSRQVPEFMRLLDNPSRAGVLLHVLDRASATPRWLFRYYRDLCWLFAIPPGETEESLSYKLQAMKKLTQ